MTQVVPPADIPGHVIPQTRMRAAIARRMTQSKQEAPHFYVSTDVVMDGVTSVVRTLNDEAEQGAARVTVTAVLAKGVADTLAHHPNLNGRWTDDGLFVADAINLGVAVLVEDGLVAPAITDCGGLSVLEMASRLTDLSGRARSGKLRGTELTAPTFTLSNLGMYDIVGFTAILPPPQVAILATGRANPRTVVVDDAVVVRHVMEATLSVDHRAVDGAAAADFLGALKHRLESAVDWAAG